MRIGISRRHGRATNARPCFHLDASNRWTGFPPQESWPWLMSASQRFGHRAKAIVLQCEVDAYLSDESDRNRHWDSGAFQRTHW
jgi:hypothetical protein